MSCEYSKTWVLKIASDLSIERVRLRVVNSRSGCRAGLQLPCAGAIEHTLSSITEEDVLRYYMIWTKQTRSGSPVPSGQSVVRETLAIHEVQCHPQNRFASAPVFTVGCPKPQVKLLGSCLIWNRQLQQVRLAQSRIVKRGGLTFLRLVLP